MCDFRVKKEATLQDLTTISELPIDNGFKYKAKAQELSEFFNSGTENDDDQADTLVHKLSILAFDPAFPKHLGDDQLRTIG